MSAEAEMPSWIAEALRRSEEPLHPDLAPYLVNDGQMGWSMLKHPLVYAVPYTPQMAYQYNKQYLAKQRSLDVAHKASDWGLVLALHERPYRIDAFTEITHLMTDREYWEALAWLWTDSENIRETADVWEEMILSDRPEREAMMTEEEAVALAAMPEEILVYQGHTSERSDGLSWTVRENIALWFARRFALLESDQPAVTYGRAYKRDVIAYFMGRNEYEVLLLPEHVEVITTHTYDHPDDVPVDM